MTTPEETGPELREKIARLADQKAWKDADSMIRYSKGAGLDCADAVADLTRPSLLSADAILALLPPNQGARPEDGWLSELERMRTEAVALTLKYGAADGTDYEQGAQDQGHRWVSQLDAALKAAPARIASGGGGDLSDDEMEWAVLAARTEDGNTAISHAAMRAAFKAVSRPAPVSPVPAGVGELIEAAKEAQQAIAAAKACSAIEWAEYITASKRGQDDDDESRTESKAMVFGLLNEAEDRLRAAIASASLPEVN